MLDFLLGIALAGLMVRGWARGFVREALDLVGLIFGVWVALWLSQPLGEFLSSRFGVSPEVAGIAAGVTLFFLFGVAMAVAARYLTRVMTLPGLNMVNRVGGAAVAVAWGLVLMVVILNVALALPLPESWDEAIEESGVAQAIIGPDALPQRVFEALAPDDVLASLSAIQEVVGSNRAVPEGNEVIDIPPAASDEIRQVRDEATEVLEWVNEHRAGLGLRALTTSDVFTEVGESRAVLMYTTGRISRDTPAGSSVITDLEAAGARPSVAGENLALASSAQAAFDGMLDSPTGLAQLNTPGYDRVGVAVVDGPTGRLVIVVFGG